MDKRLIEGQFLLSDIFLHQRILGASQQNTVQKIELERVYLEGSLLKLAEKLPQISQVNLMSVKVNRIE